MKYYPYVAKLGYWLCESPERGKSYSSFYVPYNKEREIISRSNIITFAHELPHFFTFNHSGVHFMFALTRCRTKGILYSQRMALKGPSNNVAFKIHNNSLLFLLSSPLSKSNFCYRRTQQGYYNYLVQHARHDKIADLDFTANCTRKIKPNNIGRPNRIPVCFTRGRPPEIGLDTKRLIKIQKELIWRMPIVSFRVQGNHIVGNVTDRSLWKCRDNCFGQGTVHSLTKVYGLCDEYTGNCKYGTI